MGNPNIKGQLRGKGTDLVKK